MVDNRKFVAVKAKQREFTRATLISKLKTRLTPLLPIPINAT